MRLRRPPRADPRNQQDEALPERLPEGFDLRRRSDDSAEAGAAGEAGEAERLAGNVPGSEDLGGRPRIEVGQHGHSEEQRRARGPPDRADGRFQHGEPSRGVHIHDAGAERRRRADGSPDGSGNVVVLQIEEDPAHRGEFAHDRRSGGGEEFLADLEEGHRPGETVAQTQGAVEGSGVHGSHEFSAACRSGPRRKKRRRTANSSGAGGHHRPASDPGSGNGSSAPVSSFTAATRWRRQ